MDIERENEKECESGNEEKQIDQENTQQTCTYCVYWITQGDNACETYINNDGQR